MRHRTCSDGKLFSYMTKYNSGKRPVKMDNKYNLYACAFHELSSVYVGMANGIKADFFIFQSR